MVAFRLAADRGSTHEVCRDERAQGALLGARPSCGKWRETDVVLHPLKADILAPIARARSLLNGGMASSLGLHPAARRHRRIIAPQTAGVGRVGVWRGGVRPSMSVSAPFVWRCLSGSTLAPFPHPSHRTGHADRPHPALGQDLTPSSTTALS